MILLAHVFLWWLAAVCAVVFGSAWHALATEPDDKDTQKYGMPTVLLFSLAAVMAAAINWLF